MALRQARFGDRYAKKQSTVCTLLSAYCGAKLGGLQPSEKIVNKQSASALGTKLVEDSGREDLKEAKKTIDGWFGVARILSAGV